MNLEIEVHVWASRILLNGKIKNNPPAGHGSAGVFLWALTKALAGRSTPVSSINLSYYLYQPEGKASIRGQVKTLRAIAKRLAAMVSK